MDSKLHNLQEKHWIEQTFQKRDCVKYVPSDKQLHRCMCGRLKLQHPSKPESTVRVAYPVQRWSVSQHTEASPTDAYGTIEFQGGPHPTKAEYIRLSYDTEPKVIMQLLQRQWGLDFPKLLLSIHGGIANFDLQPKLKRVCYQGLLQAAKITGAWIVTGGINTGVMKHVGDALGDTMIQARNNIVTIGIVPWGVVYRNEELVGKDVVRTYHCNAQPKGNSVVLNSNHSYFLLVDDGTVGKMGCEIIFRKKLEKYILQQKLMTAQASSSSHGTTVRYYNTPVVCLVLEGGCNTIRSVLDYLTDQQPVPVVVCDGSGRAADLLAFTYKFTQDDDGRMPESLRDQLLFTIMRTFHCSTDRAEQIFVELMMCIRKKHLITVFRIGEETNDIDLAILSAVLKFQTRSAQDQLHLALTWNRADLARSYIFVYGQEWPEGALDNAMMDALVNDRVDFVKLLLDNGVNPQKWLTIERLEELYNIGLTNNRLNPVKSRYITGKSQKQDSSSTLRFLLKEYKKHIPIGYRYTLLDIGQVINKLMGGTYQSSYCRKKFRSIYNAITHKGHDVSSAVAGVASNVVTLADPAAAFTHVFKLPYSDLMIWAVLLRRQDMARLMWRRGDENIVKALIAFKLYKSMSKEADDDDIEADIATELQTYAKEFEDLAVNLLEQCFRTNETMTQLLLTYELANWSDQTCLSLAASASHRPFIANPACQMLLTEMWMGGLRTRKYAFLKVILGIVLFPSFLLLEYRSREELQLMPQTKEEHIQEMKESSELDSDSEADNDSIKSGSSGHSDHSERDRTERRRRTTSLSAPPKQVSSGNVDEGGQLVAVSPQDNENVMQYVPSPSATDVGLLPSYEKKSPLTFQKKVYEFYTAPITKFWMHTISYVIFLFLFIYTVLIRSREVIEWNEWYVVVFVFALALEKIREFFAAEPNKVRQKFNVFFSDAWNVFDVLATFLFIMGFIIRQFPDYVSDGRVFYCVSVTIFVIRILGYFDISRRLGPFNHIIGKMVVQMLYFIIFLLIIIIAYGVLLQSTWFPDKEFDWGSVRDIFIKPYFNLYGEVYADEVWPKCGEDEDFQCVPGRWLAPIAQTAFLIIGILLLLTLLIATFNAIFIRTNAISHLVWKYQRYKVVIEYEARPFLPPPLVILCHIYMFIKFVRRKCLHRRKFLDNGLKLFLSDEVISQINDFEEECLDAYFHQTSEDLAASSDERIRLTADRLENVMLRLDDIHRRENAIRDYLQTMDSYLAKVGEQALSNVGVLQNIQQQIHAICSHMNVPKTPSLGAQKTGPDSGGSSVLSQSNRPTVGGNVAAVSRLPPRFNSQRLRPFTAYPKPRPPLHRGLSVDVGELVHLRAAGGRSRHYSVSTCEDLVPALAKKSSSVAAVSDDDESVEQQQQRQQQQPQNHVCFKDVPEYLSDSGGDICASLSNMSISPRPSTLKMMNFMPLTPIVTPSRVEYTSITDDIDTSCVRANDSPPNTPLLEHEGFGSAKPSPHKKGHHHRHRHNKKKPEIIINEGLKNAEENENQQMEGIIHRRMYELTLTETATMVDLAKHALETMESAPAGDDNELGAARKHHSDDEMPETNSLSNELGIKQKMKSVRSEPLLKKQDQQQQQGLTPASATPTNTDSSLGSEGGIHFVAASDSSVTDGQPRSMSLC